MGAIHLKLKNIIAKNSINTLIKTNKIVNIKNVIGDDNFFKIT